jgi:DNA-binding IclR family transcriptional regulator
MSRPSPPTERVVRVLGLLAERPKARPTLTEISQRLGITKATCLGIVGTLVRAGYLVRDDATKTYALGPALLGLGRAAQAGFASLEVARPHLRALTARFGLSATASTLLGDDIVVLDRTGPPGDLDSAVQVGQRYPYAPPSGVVFTVWLDDDGIDRWLANYPPVAIDRRRLRALARSARQRGYLVERMSEVSVSSYTLLAGLTAQNPTPAVTRAFNAITAAFPDRYYMAEELRGLGRLPVSLVCAPTYTSTGTPDLLMAVFVLRELTPPEITEIGTAVRAAAEDVTQRIDGVDPWVGAA